ncbi:hypothetical protein [Pedobacter deserti]|uniref:hypothetical protein n=1 Tax=Pedobacter deserti TaxID=2817382 RepID=UPI00210AF85B|nr:hypothetical protein [Pedobacter sp. SYSU D00382]
MNKVNSEYPALYNGYFDLREPFIKDLEDVYSKPIQIPACGPEEIFTDEAINLIAEARILGQQVLCMRNEAETATEAGDTLRCAEKSLKILEGKLVQLDLDAFRYFHFIAARRFELDTLKEKYRAYKCAAEDTEPDEVLCEERKRDLLNYQAELEGSFEAHSL